MRRRPLLQMLLIGVLAGVGVGLVAYFIPWLPEQAAKEATAIDSAYWFVAIVCAAIFAVVAGVSIYAGWKFRAPPDDLDDGKPIHGHTGLEVTWTVIPAALVTAMSVWSGIVLYQIEDIPDDHRIVEVTAQQFAWSFRYPDLELTTGELVVPVDEPVELRIQARDVIHSFWVPDWRVKKDAVPGMTTALPVTPTKVGTFPVICAELCGLGHPSMRSRAVVMEREDFERWIRETREAAQAGGASGEELFANLGCGDCHVLEEAGTTGQVGPNLDESLQGKDADYVRESIVDPDAVVAEGFQPGVMPQDYDERLSDEQLDALVEYLLEAARRG